MVILIICFILSIAKYFEFIIRTFTKNIDSNIVIDENSNYKLNLSNYDLFIIFITFATAIGKLYYYDVSDYNMITLWFIPYVLLSIVLSVFKTDHLVIYLIKFLFNFYILLILLGSITPIYIW